MDGLERRNEIPAAGGRLLEYCVYGTFVVSEHDVGFKDRRWLSVDEITKEGNIKVEDLQDKVKHWMEELEGALDAACDSPPLS